MSFEYNGWERDYLNNQKQYDELFRNSIMAGEQDVSINFLEEQVSHIAKRRYAASVANATDGLQFALEAHGIKAGDEVLVSNFSWISSATPVLAIGAIPVFCEIDSDTYQITLDSIKRMSTNNTVAIIYPCLFGAIFPEIFDVVEWCKENNIIFIEDSSQLIGTQLNGVPAGSIGDISVYSFNDNKVIAGINGGGMVMTNDKNIRDHVAKLAYHGRGSSWKDRDVKYLGRNSKMYLFNAKVIELRLNKIKEYQSRRQSIAKIYDEFFANHKQVYVQSFPHNLNHNYHKYVIRFENKKIRDSVKEKTGANVHYDPAISQNTYFKNKYKTDKTSVSEHCAGTIMSLPIHAWMTNEEVEEICETIDHSLWESYIY
jgi:UDP-2-acetamido-2-deoxy-ribo-hexuluronate aminotransferase